RTGENKSSRKTDIHPWNVLLKPSYRVWIFFNRTVVTNYNKLSQEIFLVIQGSCLHKIKTFAQPLIPAIRGENIKKSSPMEEIRGCAKVLEWDSLLLLCGLPFHFPIRPGKRCLP